MTLHSRTTRNASRCNTRRGFSLIELLVVISIITVLISVMLPALGKARESANILRCSSGLRQIGIAMSGYSQDFGHRWINYSDGVVRWPSTLIAAERLPKAKISIFECPADTIRPTDPLVQKWELGGSYGFNNDINAYGRGPSSVGQPIGKRTDQVKLPGEYATLWDCNQPLIASSVTGWVFDRSTYATRLPDPTRHMARGNVLFMDARASTVVPQDIPQVWVTFTHQ